MKIKNILLFMVLIVVAFISYVISFICADGTSSTLGAIICQVARVIFLILSFPTYYLVYYLKLDSDFLSSAVVFNVLMISTFVPKLYQYFKIKSIS